MNTFYTPIARAAVTLSMLVVCTIAIADNTHYQWRDERGTLIHSDRPPPAGIEYEVVEPGSDFKRVVSPEEGAVPLETEPTVGNDFEQVDRSPDVPDGGNAVMCERARRYMETLTYEKSPSVRDEQGDLRPLTETEILQERARAEELILENCR